MDVIIVVHIIFLFHSRDYGKKVDFALIIFFNMKRFVQNNSLIHVNNLLETYRGHSPMLGLKSGPVAMLNTS